MAVVVGTWSFSFEAVKLISEKLRAGSECVDALESGINGNVIRGISLGLSFVKFVLVLDWPKAHRERAPPTSETTVPSFNRSRGKKS